MISENKRACTQKRIGTHDGTFHCDEALACYLLRKTEAFKGAIITRTRDPAVLNTMDVVVDVGGTYEPEKLRFDHHQRGFEHTFDDAHKTKLSSAGLVYKHFGMEIIKGQVQGDEAKAKLLYVKMYDNFIEELDGVDNGVTNYPSDVPCKYKVSSTLSQRVGRLNPPWNAKCDDKNMQERFEKAMETAGAEFSDMLDYYVNAWLPAKQLVQEAIQNRHEVDPSGQIMVMKSSCPWKEHLFELEKQMNVEKPILYVLYADESGKWRIQCVPEKPDGFENRKSIGLETWRGVRDEALSELVGVPGCIFVHATGFIGGHANYEGVLTMARMSLAAS